MTEQPSWHWVPINPARRNPESCGATRGRFGRVTCELPPDHVVGRSSTAMIYEEHLGRTRTGAWVQWRDSQSPARQADR